MTHTSQRFSIVDLLSLVAAFSIAFAILVFHRRRWAAFGADWTSINTLTVNWFGFGMTLCVCSFYLGLMVLRRRPDRRLLASSPGRAATLAICIASLLAMLTSWDSFFASVFSLPVTLLHLPFTIGGSPLVAASAGLTAWIAVSVTSDAQLPPDWLDRSGKICTVFWLLLSFAQPVLNLEVLKAIGFPLD
ncbi:hypothetical protein [Rhodopirellula islandica]|uniref:hypothetical protein n=1 Tax=Rhodopirellula islandica TaxID=595434 RepID=UPI0012374FAF|nr:hypothetical protein [Rhodopirellula islandica]